MSGAPTENEYPSKYSKIIPHVLGIRVVKIGRYDYLMAASEKEGRDGFQQVIVRVGDDLYKSFDLLAEKMNELWESGELSTETAMKTQEDNAS